MNTHLKTQDIVVIGISAALYAVFGILTAGFNFLGVGFLPAVVIPAVFAVLYGPWVGGLGAAIGIFIRDMFVHGNPALSLVAGVPANFIVFFLIGYIALRNISLKQALAGITIAAVGLLVPTIVFLPDFAAFTGLSTEAFPVNFRINNYPKSCNNCCSCYSLERMEKLCYRRSSWASYRCSFTFSHRVGCQSIFPLILRSTFRCIILSFQYSFGHLPQKYHSFCLLDHQL